MTAAKQLNIFPIYRTAAIGKWHFVLKFKSPRFSAPMPISAGESAAATVPGDDMAFNRRWDMPRVGRGKPQGSLSSDRQWGRHLSRFILRKVPRLDEMIQGFFENHFKASTWMLVLE